MSKGMKTFIMVCGIVIGAGILLSVAGAALGGLNGLSGVEERVPWISFGGSGEEVSSSVKLENFRDIDLECDMGDVEFIESDRFAADLSYDKKLGAPKLSVQNGTLHVSPGKTRRQDWFQMNIFGKDYADTNIRIYYPKNTAFDKVEVANDMGAVQLKGLIAKTLDIQIDSGDLEMDRIRADKMKLNVDTGNADGTRIHVRGADIQIDTGCAELSGSFAGRTNIHCDLGDCVLTTQLPKESYAIDMENDLGECMIDGKEIYESYTIDNVKAKNKMSISVDSGSAEVNFQ